MPEVTIKYEKPETLKILKGLAEYLDFKVSSSATKKEISLDDILVPNDKNADLSKLNKVFTGKDLDAKKLREQLWRKTK